MQDVPPLQAFIQQVGKFLQLAQNNTRTKLFEHD